MGDKIERKNKVIPVFNLPDQKKVENEFGKGSLPIIRDIAPGVKEFYKKPHGDSLATGQTKPTVRGKFNFISLVKSVFLYVRCLISPQKKQNQFFCKEEQRKFELNMQLRKQWPNELLNNSYILRRDR